MIGQRFLEFSEEHGRDSNLWIAVCAGLLLGVSSLRLSPFVPLGAVLGCAAFFLMVRWPEVAVLGVIAFTSTIVDPDSLPLIPIGIGSLHPSELLLVGLIGVFLCKLATDRTFRSVRGQHDLPMAVFFVIVLLSAGTSFADGTSDRHNIFREVRTLTYLVLMYFIGTQLFRSRRQIQFLLAGLMVLACATACAMLLQAFLGPSVEIIPRSVLSVAGYVQPGGVFRVTPPGQTLVRALFVLLASRLMLSVGSAKDIPQFALLLWLGLALLVTFNRNYWAGTGVSLLVGIVLVGPATSGRLAAKLLAMMPAAALLVGSIFLLVQAFQVPYTQELADSVQRRVGAVSTEAGVQDALESRQEEIPLVMAAVNSEPIIGVGLGAAYRPRTSYETDATDLSFYTHNAYLWILSKMGIVGFAAFSWLTISLLASTLFHWKRGDTVSERSTVLAAGILYLGLMVSAPFSPVFLESAWTPVIGLMTGLSEATLVGCPKH